MTFATIDAAPLMAAGHHTKAVEYLLGNHVVAEQMFRHDPLALLYAPLRILIPSDTNNEAIFSLDQPSTVFERPGGLRDHQSRPRPRRQSDYSAQSHGRRRASAFSPRH